MAKIVSCAVQTQKSQKRREMVGSKEPHHYKGGSASMLFSELGRREVYLSKMLEHIFQDVISKLLFHGQATNG